MTSKQRAYLRSLATGIPAIMQIGKGELTDPMLQGFDSALSARELIKLHVLPNCDTEPKEMLALLCEKLNAEPVTAIGRKIVLYRPAEKPVIELP